MRRTHYIYYKYLLFIYRQSVLKCASIFNLFNRRREKDSDSAYLDLPPIICLLLANFRICEGMFLLEDNLQKVVVIRRMIFADILVFFKALAQLLRLRFTIETFCHFLELCDCQNTLAPRRRLSLFLSVIGKEDDTFYGYRQTSSKVGKCQQVMRTQAGNFSQSELREVVRLFLFSLCLYISSSNVFDLVCIYIHCSLRQKTYNERQVMQAFETLLRNNVNVNMNPDNWEGVFERRTSIGSEAFYLLNLYWYLTLLLQRRFAKKFGQNNYLRMLAETSLPIAVSRLKTPVRSLTSLI